MHNCLDRSLSNTSIASSQLSHFLKFQDIRLAKILANSGKPIEALKIVEDVLSKQPTQDAAAHAQLLHFRGVCLEATGNVPGVRRRK